MNHEDKNEKGKERREEKGRKIWKRILKTGRAPRKY